MQVPVLAAASVLGMRLDEHATVDAPIVVLVAYVLPSTGLSLIGEVERRNRHLLGLLHHGRGAHGHPVAVGRRAAEQLVAHRTAHHEQLHGQPRLVR